MASFNDIKKYFKNEGLKDQIDYTIHEDIDVIEFNINGFYFCSVALYDGGLYEVYELHHGATVSDDGRSWVTDGKLWQYKLYKSLKNAVVFALKCKRENKLPSKAIRIW